MVFDMMCTYCSSSKLTDRIPKQVEIDRAGASTFSKYCDLRRRYVIQSSLGESIMRFLPLIYLHRNIRCFLESTVTRLVDRVVQD